MIEYSLHPVMVTNFSLKLAFNSSGPNPSYGTGSLRECVGRHPRSLPLRPVPVRTSLRPASSARRPRSACRPRSASGPTRLWNRASCCQNRGARRGLRPQPSVLVRIRYTRRANWLVCISY